MPKPKELPDVEIREAYKQGVSQVFLAAYFEVSVGTIRKRLGKVSSGSGIRATNSVKPPVPGANSWLNALTEPQRLRIEQIVLAHDKYLQHLRYMMTHIGGPGYEARQRGDRGATRRDPESHVLDVRTNDYRYELYRGMPRAGQCRRSFDGGRTWVAFDPGFALEARPKIKGKNKNSYRKDAARDLQQQGLEIKPS